MLNKTYADSLVKYLNKYINHVHFLISFITYSHAGASFHDIWKVTLPRIRVSFQRDLASPLMLLNRLRK